MNIEERRILRYRFLASGILLIPIGLMIFSLLQIVVMQPNDMVLSIIALVACALFNIFEIIVMMKGWKKESNLYKIAFDEQQHVNTVPLIAVMVGTLFGLALCILAAIVIGVRSEVFAVSSMLVVLTIGSYLLINCVIYYLFLLFFRKREINLRDFIK